MWQSAALVGALSLGGSAPTEFGTCWASLWPTWIPEAVAVIAATEAPLMKVRRAIIFSSARAAAAANVPMILSAASLIKLEDVRRANPAAWYQAYLAGDGLRLGPLV